MAIVLPSEDDVFQFVIQLFQAQNPTWDLSDKSFFGLQARALAQTIMLLLDGVADADNDSVPAYQQDSDGTLLSNLSTAALDSWAITYGLPSGVPGVLGRRGATGSSGGSGIPVCTLAGTLIPAGSQLVDSTGQVTIQTTDAINTNGPPNTVAVTLVSVTTGVAANLPAGSVLTFVSPPVNVSPSLTLTTGLTNGQDRESDGELLLRILFRLQNPPRGGTAADYRYWSETSVDLAQNNRSNNIARAYPYPLRSGLGTVDVMPLLRASGTARNPGSAIQGAVQAYIDSVRPVTAVCNVRLPYMPAARAVQMRLVLLPYTKYAPDWNDGRSLTTITFVDAGNMQLGFAAIPPALEAAINSGRKPRVAVIVSTTGASPKPYQARAIGIPLANRIQLDSWPFGGTPPVATVDVLYAGGPYLDTIAQNLLTFVDNLGPSRQSGFADPYDVWEWEITPARVADIVMEARDADGTRFIQDIPRMATDGLGLKTAAMGGFTFNKISALDVVGDIELLYLKAGGLQIFGTPA